MAQWVTRSEALSDGGGSARIEPMPDRVDSEEKASRETLSNQSFQVWPLRQQ